MLPRQHHGNTMLQCLAKASERREHGKSSSNNGSWLVRCHSAGDDAGLQQGGEEVPVWECQKINRWVWYKSILVGILKNFVIGITSIIFLACLSFDFKTISDFYTFCGAALLQLLGVWISVVTESNSTLTVSHFGVPLGLSKIFIPPFLGEIPPKRPTGPQLKNWYDFDARMNFF